MASVNWLKSESALSDQQQMQLYRKVKYYNFAREKKKSIVWAAFVLCMAGMSLLLRWNYSAVACLVLFFVALNQHNIGYRLAKKRCANEIAKAFPQWLMEISLLLQISDNVNAAIAKSIGEAPAILTESLNEMHAQIMENPESNEPYMNYMKEFGLLEIQSAMGMLYSISSGRGGDAQLQIDEILAKNAAMLSQSESASNDNRLAALYWQFLFPSIIGGGKLIADMTLVTIAFMSSSLY